MRTVPWVNRPIHFCKTNKHTILSRKNKTEISLEMVRHENDVHNSSKTIFRFLKKNFFCNFHKWSEPSRGEPSRSKNGFGANRPGRNWFWSEPSRHPCLQVNIIFLQLSNHRYIALKVPLYDLLQRYDNHLIKTAL